MTIRLATEADLPALTDIYNAAVTGTDATCDLEPRTLGERRDWWQAHLAPHYPVLVAEEEGAALGYASLSSWVNGAVYAHTAESSLYLAPGARGRGLGTTLMRALLEEAARVGHHVVIARIWAGNAASLAMCRRCGFETVGVQREVGRRHGVWEDCVLLQCLVPGQIERGDV